MRGPRAAPAAPTVSETLLDFVRVCVRAQSLQLCLTLCDPIDHSPPGSYVQWVLQARILEWVACPPPRDLPNPGIKPEIGRAHV